MDRQISRVLSGVMALVQLMLVSASANAANLLHFTFSAGVRENFVTSRDYDYGGEGMSRVKRHLADVGFESFTLALRLGMESAQDSYVYTPSMRTSVNDIEVFIARTDHSQSELILKPIIGKKPELGVIRRLTQIHPQNSTLWFASYRQSINPYLAVAARKKIAEFVLAVGMHKLWTPEFADPWILLAKDARRQLGNETRLSIELSSREDMDALENWRSQSPQTYSQFISQFDRIRVSADVGSILPVLSRARDLFEGKPLSLAHLVVPACNSVEREEDEIQCAPGAPDSDAYTRQSQVLKQVLDELEHLPSEVLSVLKQVEIFYATTYAEPAPSKVDARLPIFNKSLKTWLKEWSNTHVLTKTAIDNRLSAHVTGRLACIYYDKEPEDETIGPIQSRLIENLLGAFPNWKVRRQTVLSYQKGDVSSCDIVFSLATNFNVTPPESFYREVSEFLQKKPVVWMNYRFESFQKEYKILAEQKGYQPIAFSVPKVEQPLLKPSRQVPDPGFYRFFDYKGETFEKLAYWDPVVDNFAASPELNLIVVKNHSKIKVLSTARHSSIKSEVPYVILQPFLDPLYENRPDPLQMRKGNLWYIADSPFSFVHYEDRYLIFCDLLWDMLGETPPEGPLVALLRIEDVNPSLKLENMQWAVDYLTENNIPHSLAVIPYYSSLFTERDGQARPIFKAATDYPDFLGFLRYAKARGSEFIFHGMSHAAGDLISGYDGASASDYEFWLYPENRPHPQDSSDFVLDRLEMGEAVFNKLGIRPIAWEVPHYAASALDFILFGKLFSWNYHRGLYFKGKWNADDLGLSERHRIFDCVTSECRLERREISRGLKVAADYSQFSGQIFPYPIYRDSYGQSVIPETLGMIDWAFFPDDTIRLVSRPDDLLRRARKLKVVRGAYASFFWHSDLLNEELVYYKQNPESYETVGGKNTLIRVVQGLKEMGYQFRSVSDCKLFPQAGCKNTDSVVAPRMSL